MWAEEVEPPMDLGEVALIDEIEQLPPPSVQKPPPPPPPPPPPKLEIVEDDEVIEEEPEIIDTEADEEVEVDIPDDINLDDFDDEGEEEVEVVIEEEEPEEPEIFSIVEQMPEFPGGQAKMFKFISKNIKYPAMARENGISGTVFVMFVVNEDGAISDVQVRRGIGGGCDEEALRVVKKMPKWNAGKQRGKPVKVSFTLPIKFKLE